jgi:S-DNA-T family DNA segregation ATPase FtsK/SpoIIIE
VPQAPPAAPKAASTVRPSGSSPKPKQVATPQHAPKPAPAQASAKSAPPKAAKPAAKPATPAPKVAAQHPAAEPPALLTKNDVKAHKPAQWHEESKAAAKAQPKPVATTAFDEPEDETLPSPTVYRVLAALIPIVLILGMAATAIVLSRKSAFDREPEVQQAAAPSAPSESVQAVPAVPVPTTTPAAPPLVVTPDTEVTPDARISTEAQATPDTQATPPIAPAPAPAPKPRYCLSVGTYLFSDRARARTEQLSRLTHMKSWVVTTTADGSFTYRVMLGGFVKQAEAERMADKLLSSGLVSEALVEKLPS